MSGLRFAQRSESAPEKIFDMEAVASATPSIRPRVSALTPRLPTRNTGSRPWIISEEVSMNSDANPSTQTLRGKRDSGAGLLASGVKEGGIKNRVRVVI